MSSPFEDTPEDLVALQTTVRDWVKTAQDAVLSFHRRDGLFWRDSKAWNLVKSVKDDKEKDKRSLTTTSRSYMALVYAGRCLAKNDDEHSPKWIDGFESFFKKKVLRKDKDDEFEETRLVAGLTKEDIQVNTFDIAHLADITFSAEYLNVFFPGRSLNVNSIFQKKNSKELREHIIEYLEQRIIKASGKDGQVPFREGEPDSKHYFVTLHSLRALAILKPASFNFGELGIKEISESTRQFCAEQCFYSQKGIQHKQDTIRLAFAGVIYCLYAEHVDKDLVSAIIEALALAQQENGSWLATHPIFRKKNKPWHITSHEIALCLTWLYFQPRLPDTARPLLLAMMERYFTNWVIPTFVRVPVDSDDDKEPKEFKGWYDDHTIADNFAAGWATAIVCHFLANYHSVLDDHINRRVIETMGLGPSSKKYLIDETAHQSSPKWKNKRDFVDDDRRTGRRPFATWSDLPPVAWLAFTDPAELAKDIKWLWSDPSPRARNSTLLAEKILSPIGESPNGRPNPNLCAGMLPGPPGTRKTSLVKVIAKILEWPLIKVPASVFFDKGFDMMETRATEVFHHLSYLTGCVIFFDEFEEFFRKRPEKNDKEESEKLNIKQFLCRYPENVPSSSHDRTIAAFTTSAMLPRLQDLHDEGRCLIFLATNHPKQIDPAILRQGRFDYFLEIMPPKVSRIVDYLKGPMTRQTIKMLEFNVDDENRRVHESDKSNLDTLVSVVLQTVEKEPETDDFHFAWAEKALKAAKKGKDVADVLNECRETTTMAEEAEKSPYKEYKGPPPSLLSP